MRKNSIGNSTASRTSRCPRTFHTPIISRIGSKPSIAKSHLFQDIEIKEDQNTLASMVTSGLYKVYRWSHYHKWNKQLKAKTRNYSQGRCIRQNWLLAYEINRVDLTGKKVMSSAASAKFMSKETTLHWKILCPGEGHMGTTYQSSPTPEFTLHPMSAISSQTWDKNAGGKKISCLDHETQQ